MEESKFPLRGLKVIDLATMMAAPWAATYLADFGAEVIKIEHPVTGDTSRNFGAKKDGKGVFWKTLARNKQCITLDLKQPVGKDLFLKLIEQTDVLVENFRPGTMEKWGLDWGTLTGVNPKLIWLRVTGFGQEGPYSSRGGFGSIAEGLSGFAAANGYPDSPPTLPPLPLADGVCSVFAGLAVMMALYERDAIGSGKGQIIDISLYEPLMRLMETSLVEYSVMGIKPKRLGNRLAAAAPRNLYQTSEGKWVSLSGSAQPIAANVFKAIGKPDLINDPKFHDNAARIKNVEELDLIIGEWIGSHTLEEVLAKFTDTGAIIGSVYEVDQIFADEHFKARDSLVEVMDNDFGLIKMPGMFAKFSRTPGEVRFSGPAKGAHNQEIFCGQLGISPAELEELKAKGVV